MEILRTDADPGPYDPAAPRDQSSFAVRYTAYTFRQDGLSNVCDRAHDRIQVFTSRGNSLRSSRCTPETLGMGSACSSRFDDERQTFLLVADGENKSFGPSGETMESFRDKPGTTAAMRAISIGFTKLVSDSRGDLYTGEVDTGKRLSEISFCEPREISEVKYKFIASFRSISSLAVLRHRSLC